MDIILFVIQFFNPNLRMETGHNSSSFKFCSAFPLINFLNCFFYPKEIKSNMSQSQTLILDDRNLSMVSHVALLSMSCMDSLSSYNCVLLITGYYQCEMTR